MNIEDILKEERFRELDELLTEEMRKYAGKKLLKKMKAAFEMRAFEKIKRRKDWLDQARQWFYSPNSSLKNSARPYDYCKEGKISDLEPLLDHIYLVHNDPDYPDPWCSYT